MPKKSAPHQVVPVAGKAGTLSKPQQAFNRLLAQIKRLREQLNVWQTFELTYTQTVTSELMPAAQALAQKQKALAVALDKVWQSPPKGLKWTQPQRKVLKRAILHLVDQVLMLGPDEAMRDIHDRYAEATLDEMEREEFEFTEAMLSDVLGQDAMAGHEAKSAEELLHLAQAKLQAKMAEDQSQAQAEMDRKQASKAAGKGAGKGASAAQLKKEQAAKEASQTVREVFRKLASALHPDRATDEADRAQRTAMMQRVNQAYERNDLLALLNLQMEIEQIDASHLAELSEARLKHYNQVLTEQVRELELELVDVQMPYRAGLQMSFFGDKLTPQQVTDALNAELAQIASQMRQMEGDLQLAQGDASALRSLLKFLTQMFKELDLAEAMEGDIDDGFEDFLDMLSTMDGPGKGQDLFGDLFAPPKPGKRRKT